MTDISRTPESVSRLLPRASEAPAPRTSEAPVTRGLDAAEATARLTEKLAAPAARKVVQLESVAPREVATLDPVGVAERIADGSMTVDLPLRSGAKLGAVLVPQGTRVVFDLAIQGGKVSFAGSRVHFADATGTPVKFDGPGRPEPGDVSVGRDGHIQVALLLERQDLTRVLVGAERLPSEPEALAALLLGRMPHKPHARPPVVDPARVHVQAQGTLKAGDLALGEGAVLHLGDASSSLRFVGDAEKSELELRGNAAGELGAAAAHVSFGPSELQLRVIDDRLQKRRTLGLGDSRLENVQLVTGNAEAPLVLHTALVRVDGTERALGAAAFDGLTVRLDRKGTLDLDLASLLGSERAAALAAQHGTIELPPVTLRAGTRPLAVLPLDHPLVQAALRDPAVRREVTKAEQSIRTLAEGYKMMHAGVPEMVGPGEAQFEAAKAELASQFVALGGMEPNGKAEALLSLVYDALVENGKLPDGGPEKKAATIALVVGSMRAAIWIEQQPTFTPWKELGQKLIDAVAQDDATRTAVGSLAWQQELETLCHVTFSANNAVESYADGTAFFAGVKKLIDETPKPGPIEVNYWAIYDDVSGKELAELLAKKKREGYELSVVVDAKTSFTHGAKEALPILRAAGVPLVLWQDPDPSRFPTGTHEKYVVTPLGVVTGGSNAGDVYTHAGAPETPKWSDTNVRLSGPITERFFALHEAMLARLGETAPARTTPIAKASGTARIAVVEDFPSDANHPILLATLKMLEGTAPGETVRIKNAYFVMTGPLEQAIARALARGVNVEIFTNSPVSVDEPAVAGPILDSTKAALALGERIRGEKGEGAGNVTIFMPGLEDHNTVHDKVTMAGDVVAVMTYNMHPRSETLEKELATVVVDAKTAGEQRARWDRALEGALRIDSTTHPLYAQRELGYKDVLLEVFKNIF